MWNNEALQFARLVGEIGAVGLDDETIEELKETIHNVQHMPPSALGRGRHARPLKSSGMSIGTVLLWNYPGGDTLLYQDLYCTWG